MDRDIGLSGVGVLTGLGCFTLCSKQIMVWKHGLASCFIFVWKLLVFHILLKDFSRGDGVSMYVQGLEIVCEGEKVKKNRDLGFQPNWLGGFWCHFLKCEDCIWILLWMINVFHPEQTLSFSARSMDRDDAGCFILLTASPAAPLYRHRREPICTLARISRQICYASVFQDTLL